MQGLTLVLLTSLFLEVSSLCGDGNYIEINVQGLVIKDDAVILIPEGRNFSDNIKIMGDFVQWHIIGIPPRLEADGSIKVIPTDVSSTVYLSVNNLSYMEYSALVANPGKVKPYYRITVNGYYVPNQCIVSRDVLFEVQPNPPRFTSTDKIYIDDTTVGNIHTITMNPPIPDRSAIVWTPSLSGFTIADHTGIINLDTPLPYNDEPYRINVTLLYNDGRISQQDISIYVQTTRNVSKLVFLTDENIIVREHQKEIIVRANTRHCRFYALRTNWDLTLYDDGRIVLFEPFKYGQDGSIAVEASIDGLISINRTFHIHVENILDPPYWDVAPYVPPGTRPYKIVVYTRPGKPTIPVRSAFPTPRAVSPDNATLLYYMEPVWQAVGRFRILETGIIVCDDDIGPGDYLLFVIAEAFPFHSILVIQYTVIQNGTVEMEMTTGLAKAARPEHSLLHLLWLIAILPIALMATYLCYIHLRPSLPALRKTSPNHVTQDETTSIFLPNE